MNNPNDEPVNEAAETPAETPAVEQPEKKTIEQKLKDEMKKWQGQIDELKLQVSLGAMDARDQAQPHIEKLEQELAKADKELKEFGQASEGAWQELSKGVKLSFKEIQVAAEKAKQQFEPKKD